MLAAVRTHIQRGLEVFLVQHRLAARTLDPHPLWHPLAGGSVASVVAVNTRRKDFVYPTHCSFPNIPGLWPGVVRDWSAAQSTARTLASRSAAAAMARASLSCPDRPCACADCTAASMVSMILLPMTTASA